VISVRHAWHGHSLRRVRPWASTILVIMPPGRLGARRECSCFLQPNYTTSNFVAAVNSQPLFSLCQYLTCRTTARQSTFQHFTSFTPQSFILSPKYIYQKGERELPQFSHFQCVDACLITTPSCLDPKELTNNHTTKSFELCHNATVGCRVYAWHKPDGASCLCPSLLLCAVNSHIPIT